MAPGGAPWWLYAHISVTSGQLGCPTDIMDGMDENENSGLRFARTEPIEGSTQLAIADSADELIIITGPAVERPAVTTSDPLTDSQTNPDQTESTAARNSSGLEMLPPMSGTQRVVIGTAFAGSVMLVAFLVMYWVFGFRFM